MRIFFASILNFVLFHCYICHNIKILQKKLFDWASIGGATIFPRSLRTTGNEKHFWASPKFFIYLLTLYMS
jgi:hypothetical protein